jgi:cytochrome o ubiquinol oxidase subunit II
VIRHRIHKAIYLTGLLTLALPLSACNIGILDPKGPVGAAQKTILFNSVGIMLAIVLPTILAIFAFAWWYRASNTRSRYLPDFAYSGRIELVVWAIPALVVMLLGGVAWIGSHDLDPAKSLESSHKPLRVQVVSLDWKWLFVYPDQTVASVNTLTIPAGVPVQFSLTSASVMNAFFIPQLGSMIYTMNGMTTRLNLQADVTGVYPGLSSHYSGGGFADMNFKAHVVSAQEFASWVETTQKSTEVLNANAYSGLAKQSAKVAPATFRLESADLFDLIATQQLPPGPGPVLANPGMAQPPGAPSHRGGHNVR